MRRASLALALVLLATATAANGEVLGVNIVTRAVVANGQSFGATGAYEKLEGTIGFAIDPADSRNAAIAQIQAAPRGADGRVHFTADLFVLKPVDAARGNGVLLFEIANRGGKGLLGRFNGARTGAANPTDAADFGDGFLLRQGYTLVWVGWEFDVPPALLGIEAPAARVGGPSPLRVDFIRDEASPTASLQREAPLYLPARLDDPADTLTVRDRFWDAPTPIERSRWQFVDAQDGPTLRLEGGFEAGRIYAVSYKATGARVAGAGLAAIRDAASAFRYREDMPVRGRAAYVIGFSQSGRFLRQFLHDGFNTDERGRRAFDAVWAHIAGAARGSFNEPMAMPRHLEPYTATRLPFTEYPRENRPKIFFTNTSVEYWGGGRAAALTHTSLDGRSDLDLPGDVRIYLLAGTQHGEAPMPPPRTSGQALENPTPQRAVMRALLVGLHGWVSRNQAPPGSRYPRIEDGTLVPAARVRFPAIPGAGDPRTITPPAVEEGGARRTLPHLVPQVDADGNEVAGIRVPEQAVPLGTTTGWNFRSPAVGNPGDTYPLLGSYLPFARTRAERDASGDPRRSIEERYRSMNDYLRRVREAADALVKDRYLLPEDVAAVVERAEQHWRWAAGS